MVDFEEGRISVRLSESTFFALQRDIADFCFVGKNGMPNENGFYNTILPALHRNRVKDGERLKKLLDSDLSIKIKAENRDEIKEIFYKYQFEDKGKRFRQAKIDIRLSKENMELFKDVFSLIKVQKISKSAYIRMLLNQYVSMQTDAREYLCYERRYEELASFASERIAIEHLNAGCVEEFWPIAVDVCCINSEYYVIGVVPKDDDMILKAYRLCEFRKYKSKHCEYVIDGKLLKVANKYITEFEYFKKPQHYLRGNGNESG